MFLDLEFGWRLRWGKFEEDWPTVSVRTQKYVCEVAEEKLRQPCEF